MSGGCCAANMGDGDAVTPASGTDLWLVGSVKWQVLV